MFNFSNKRQEDISSASTSRNDSMPSQANLNTNMEEVPQKLSQEEFIKQRVAEIEEQHKAFLQKKPDFDMKAELNNKIFVDYLWKNGLSVEDAYLLAHRDEVIESAVSDGINRIMNRRNRITENGACKGSPVSVKKNPKELSDKEIDKIIERVKNGEKISF